MVQHARVWSEGSRAPRVRTTAWLFIGKSFFGLKRTRPNASMQEPCLITILPRTVVAHSRQPHHFESNGSIEEAPFAALVATSSECLHHLEFALVFYVARF